jgi:hypothetical protein
MNLQNIPKEIQALNQWVGVARGSKVPVRVDTLYSASSTNPNTWGSFEQASKALEYGHITHPGFVFNDNGIIGIDIDDGYDEEGFLSPLAADIIGKCKSYTEKSKSGRGFHILLKGDLPFKGKNNRNGVEIYKTARYFIMTGDVVLYDAIIDNQEAIDYIVDKYFPEMRASENKGVTPKIYTPIWDKPMIDGRIKLRPVYPLIPDGCRNICLTSLAGMLHNQGYSPQAIYDELTYCNTVACEPMLPDGEVVSIVHSVTRYKR